MKRYVLFVLVASLLVASFFMARSATSLAGAPATSMKEVPAGTIPKEWGHVVAGVGSSIVMEASDGTIRLINLWQQPPVVAIIIRQ